MIRQRKLKLALLLPLALAGCGSIEDTVPQTEGNRLASLDTDLGPAAQGADVRALQDYLGRFGYFPNESLARTYPAWRPATTRTPTAGVFDGTTATAVKAFQKNMGLSQSGIVDTATRALLRQPRCSVPDGIPRLDPTDKFSLAGVKWPGGTTWRVFEAGAPVFGKTTIINAMAAWTAQTSLVLEENEINFLGIYFVPLAAGVTSETTTTGSPTLTSATIKFNSNITWTPSTLMNRALHEIGHAIGLGHSGFDNAVMWHADNGVVSLDIDDKVAASAVYDTWTQLPGGATDVAVGANGSMWITGTTPNGSGDFGIYQFVGGTWVQSNGVAFRIAVDKDGVPWVINKANQIYKRTTNSATSGTWIQQPDSGKDIGIGADSVDSVWIVSTLAFGASDFQLRKWNGSGWDTPSDPGGAVRISVASNGVPVVVNSSGQIYRRNTNVTTAGTWDLLPGFARDIGLGGGNASNFQYAWIIGTNPVGNGNFGIYVWNEQPAGPGSPAAPAKAEWLPFSGGGVAVAVDSNGAPLLVNSAGSIYRPTK